MNNKFSIRDLSMGIALILICCFFALHPRGDQFLSPQNLSNLSIELAVTAVLALGMLLVLLPGMIDLSVGSGVGMLGGLVCVLIVRPSFILPGVSTGLPAPAALLLTLVVALLIWALMGTIIIKERVPAFIITLGGLLIFKGLHWLVIRNATIPVTPGSHDNLLALLTTYYFTPTTGYAIAASVGLALVIARLRSRRQRLSHGFDVEDGETAFMKLFISLQALLLLVIVMNTHKGVPLSLVILGCVALLVFAVTRHTRFGRYLYAIGGNEEAAVLSGIPVEKVIIGAYMLLGAIVALTGFMRTAYGGYSTTTVGNLMELDAIAACVIGGTSLKGGRGTVLGVMFGALIMATLLNGMTLLAVSPELKLIARGVVLVSAVWLDVVLARKK